ncbi:hypothetical protein [Cellulomonas carbonis]|uniref:hypothetical protein n=1 Tax=Cellulomonas carbonis TaxID=1386092 RepID=UPI000AD653C2|nr:hypothetical protein [Cellulomonas carbonis]GGB93699.1 hypothetical protein GCM10010972_02960 [Cellulomonas carbonis]
MRQVPDVLPVLSPGRHRRPKDGACFMEWASLLAGERWSDRPACTHRLLAHLARLVNDTVDDDARAGLVRLVPDVVGLVGDDPRWDYEIASLAAARALPVASREEARVLAVGLMTSERLIAVHEGRPADDLRPRARAALDEVPGEAGWARRFTAGLVSVRSRNHPGELVVEHAVEALAAAPDGAARLVRLLTEEVALCRSLRGGRTTHDVPSSSVTTPPAGPTAPSSPGARLSAQRS